LIGVTVTVSIAPRQALAHPWHRHGSVAPATDGHAADRAAAAPRSTGPFRLAAAVRPGEESDIAAAFAPFEKLGAIATRRDDTWFYVESDGIPDHPLMVGIRAWQQQVPLPQSYTGGNAWQIPLHPVRAAEPASTKNRFLRGAIAVAVNGIPIFNPLNNRGEDALAIGELDDHGGHCGRADDYHYHVAPVHLEKVVGKGKPIAYALDGYPVYGFTEPDGSPLRPLDPLGGHDDGAGGYHYHAMKGYPHLIGGFRGQVVERDGQVDPQPRARGVREALPPLRGATIVAFESPAADTRRLVYEIDGRKGSVAYTVKPDGGATFTFTDPAGRVRTESYAADSRRPGGGQGGPGGGQRPRPPEEPRPGERPPRGPVMQRPAAQPPGQARPGLVVSSPAIGPDGRLPREFTCDGAGISPPLEWRPGPEGTRSYALVLWHEAPDRLKSYWVVHGIPATTQGLPKAARNIGTTGLSDKRRAEYDPPCSKGPGAKTYHLTVYALSQEPAMPPGGADRAALLAAIRDITLAEGTLTFTYDRGAAR
jgi:phosphatidylethanolamine-binding protein (PEBP) family uncharacterized protein